MKTRTAPGMGAAMRLNCQEGNRTQRIGKIAENIRITELEKVVLPGTACRLWRTISIK